MTSYLVPPLNYGLVEFDLSRSGMIHHLNFPFIAALDLNTVLYLSQDEPSQQFSSFLEEQGITLLRLERGDNETLSETQVLSALEVILCPKNYPLHVMCKSGRNTAGIVIGCLRKLQRWNLTSIFEEHRRYNASKMRIVNEQFMELFDISSVQIPTDHPTWL